MLHFRRTLAVPAIAVIAMTCASAVSADEAQVYSVAVLPADVHSFSNVSGYARTSPDIKVVAVSVGHLKPQHLTETAPGIFEGSVKLPWLPFFLHGTYVVTFTGYDLRGHSSSGTATVKVN